MGANRSASKNNMYRPSSAFAAHYTKSKKAKKPTKVNQNKINVKTRNTRNYPNICNTSFDVMVSELNHLKKAGTKLDFYTKNPTADISTDSFEISKLANTTFGTQTKSTNRITSRSKSSKGAKKNHEEMKKNFIPDYKILKMLTKEDLLNNVPMFLGKGQVKTSLNKIKPNACNYVSKSTAVKGNFSTAIENLVNQALKSKSLNTSCNVESIKKIKSKSKPKANK